MAFEAAQGVLVMMSTARHCHLYLILLLGSLLVEGNDLHLLTSGWGVHAWCSLHHLSYLYHKRLAFKSDKEFHIQGGQRDIEVSTIFLCLLALFIICSLIQKLLNCIILQKSVKNLKINQFDYCKNTFRGVIYYNSQHNISKTDLVKPMLKNIYPSLNIANMHIELQGSSSISQRHTALKQSRQLDLQIEVSKPRVKIKM